ncbi:AAA family ATPase [Bacteroides caecimuris]|uniref:AAA family ATPase n=2 Tax=Bacteroides caecimuris TaxID=1796613 RepID=UPI002430120E|nr:AAA family ATPase [Bacteroides caecimuris]
MKIISFSYYDKVRNWGFENLEFLKLSLLVGASGVGKTQILRALENLKKIVDGKSLNGIRWEITFASLNNRIYNWKGEFEEKKYILTDAANDTQEESILLWEYLSEDEVELAKRDRDGIIFRGEKTVKLAAYQSIIYLLKAEPVIQMAESGLSKIKMMETPVPNSPIYVPEMALRMMVEMDNGNEDTLLNSEVSSIRIKLLVASRLKNKALFQSIKNRYIDIFPQVEDIRIVRQTASRDLSHMMDEYMIQIKERGVTEWIPQQDISSGMLRSLMQICEIYLCPEGSVLLMDEFENSLGVNCIDELTNDILSAKRNVQFILTSHHPYIINNIPYQNWKIVTRKGGKVTVKNASDYRIGESKHDYFMQLLQLEEFSNGVD